MTQKETKQFTISIKEYVLKQINMSENTGKNHVKRKAEKKKRDENKEVIKCKRGYKSRFKLLNLREVIWNTVPRGKQCKG